jgi:hypothetical protein
MLHSSCLRFTVPVVCWCHGLVMLQFWRHIRSSTYSRNFLLIPLFWALWSGEIYASTRLNFQLPYSCSIMLDTKYIVDIYNGFIRSERHDCRMENWECLQRAPDAAHSTYDLTVTKVDSFPVYIFKRSQVIDGWRDLAPSLLLKIWHFRLQDFIVFICVIASSVFASVV